MNRLKFTRVVTPGGMDSYALAISSILRLRTEVQSNRSIDRKIPLRTLDHSSIPENARVAHAARSGPNFHFAFLPDHVPGEWNGTVSRDRNAEMLVPCRVSNLRKLERGAETNRRIENQFPGPEPIIFGLQL